MITMRKMRMRVLLGALSITVFAGCSGTASTNTKMDAIVSRVSERATKVLRVATKINDATAVLMRVVGPVGISTFCAVQPPNCVVATEAYTLALAAQKEYTALLEDMTTANQAANGVKLATLASTFQEHYTTVTALLGKTDMKTMTEFQTNLAELKAIANQ